MSAAPPGPISLDQEGVLEVLPHREPFLFLHGVSDLVPGERARGFVAVARDHPYALGQPQVPSGLIIEAMAQLGGVAMLYDRRDEKAIVLFRSVDDFVLERGVEFGARIDLGARITRVRGRFGEVATEARCAGEPVASAILGFAILA